MSFGNDSKALDCNTKEGMDISIDINFQYRIKQTFADVSKIFYDWGQNRYQEAFYLIARSVLRSTCAEFEATSFIYEKSSKKYRFSYFPRDISKDVA